MSGKLLLSLVLPCRRVPLPCEAIRIGSAKGRSERGISGVEQPPLTRMTFNDNNWQHYLDYKAAARVSASLSPSALPPPAVV